MILTKNENKTLEEKIEFIKKMQQNTINDKYDVGFYNGIEYCLSILENKDAEYKYIDLYPIENNKNKDIEIENFDLE